MEAGYDIYGLHLDHNGSLHDEIKPIGGIKRHAIINDRQGNLPINKYATLLKFMRQSMLVD